MSYVITPISVKSFKAYPIIIAVLSSLQIMSIIYGRKFVLFCGLNVALSSIFFVPLVLYTLQIITECYGWQYGRQAVWGNFIFTGISTLFFFVIRFISSNSFTHPDLLFSYAHLIDTIWVSALLNCILIFTANYVSSVLMNYAKYITKGYWLMLRMIIVHFTAEIILSTGTLIALPYNGYTLHDTVNIIMETLIARAIIR